MRDRVSGSEYTIVAKYVIGADGGRSQIARDVDLPSEGQMDVAGSMNIVFSADLSAKVAHRPSVLYWVLQPGSDIGGIGLGLVRMVRPWNEWLIVWGYDISRAAARARRRGRHRHRPQPHRRRHGADHDPLHVAVGQQQVVRDPVSRRPGVLHGRRRPPPSAVQRAGLEHVGPGRLQPVLEAGLRAARPGRPRAARQLRPRALADRPADRAARQQVHRGVRPHLRGARHHRHQRPRRHERADAGPRRRQRGGSGPAREAQGGARAQGLRVQRPRRRDGPPLPLAAPS